jgi:hypothetical protein
MSVEAAMTKPQDTYQGPAIVPSRPSLDPETIKISQPAPVRPQMKFRAEPLLECRGILDTVALLNKESYDMITRAQEELSSL